MPESRNNNGSKKPVQQPGNNIPKNHAGVAAMDAQRWKTTAKAIRENTEKYHELFNSLSEGFAVMEVVRDEQQRVVDLMYRQVNDAFEHLTGLNNVTGKTALETTPNYDKGRFKQYQDIVDKGQAQQSEFYLGNVDRWFKLHQSRLDGAGSDFVMAVFDDITERKRAEQALLDSETRLTADLAGMKRLHELNQRLIGIGSLDAALREILALAIEFLKADRGNIQLFNADSYSLHIAAHYGHGQAFIDHFSHYGCDAVCEAALRAKNRVIIEDILSARALQGTKDQKVIEADGIRSVQSTPLITRRGEVIGMMSTHFVEPHRPAPEQLVLIDLLAATTAEFIERTRAEEALGESKLLLERELDDTKRLQKISNQIIEEDDLEASYDAILGSAMELMHADLASLQVLIPETQELLLLAHKNFHPDSAKFWKYVNAGSTSVCGRALAKGERVIVEDIEHLRSGMDEGEHEAFTLSGIVSVQSTPLISRAGNQVGMISTHWKKPHKPSERELALYDIVARQVADMLERKKAEEALKKSEEKYRTLFETMSQGYQENEIIRDENGVAVDHRLLVSNPQFERLTGLKLEDCIGKPVKEILPQIEDFWLELFDRVARSGISERCEREVASLGRWYDVYAFSIEGDHIGVLFEDITERKLQEQRQEFLLKLNDAINPLSDAAEIERIACAMLGEHFKADRVYYAEVNEAAGNFGVRQAYLAPGSSSVVGIHPISAYAWAMPLYYKGLPVVIPDIHHSDLIPTADLPAMKAVQVISFCIIPLIKDKRLVGLLSATMHVPREWREEEIKLFGETAERIWAAQERAKAEDALKKSEEKYRTLFNTMEEALAVCEVVRDDAGEVTDLTYLAFNTAHERQTGLDGNSMIGRKLSEVLTKSDIERFIPIYARVANTGEPLNFEEYVDFTGRWYAASVYPRGDELSIFYRDITERKLHEQRQKFLLMLSDVLRPPKYPVDIQEAAMKLLAEELNVMRSTYITVEDDQDSYELTARHEINAPPIPNRGRIRDFSAVQARDYRSGKTLIIYDAENEAQPEAFRAIEVRAAIAVPLVKNGQLVAIVGVHSRTPRNWTNAEIHILEELADRTWAAVERARAEQALRENEGRLNIILEGIGEAFYALDHEWRFLFASHPALKMWKKKTEDVFGRPFLECFPQAAGSASYEAHQRVMTTRVAERFETVSPVLNRRIEVLIAPTSQGGLSVSFRDVEDARRAEDAVRDSEERLSLAIEIGELASWDWNLDTGEVKWNDRHFLMQGYAVGEVMPNYETWLARVHPEDRAETISLIEQSRDSRSLYIHEFRTLHPDGSIRWCSARGQFFYHDSGEPFRMIGVMSDVTELKRREQALRESEEKLRVFNNTLEQQVRDRTAEIHELSKRQKEIEEWQQQQVFRAILDTQEEERKRIAESLHNGLGQILYGTKLSLDQAMKTDMPDHAKDNLKNTDRLLATAISESRRISHELMPAILEDFGLKSAIEDTCRQLSDGVRIKCQFKGLNKQLDKYIETAVYRIIQELLMNIVKHSKATEALVAIELQKHQMLILVRDNGIGINPNAEKNSGIGLRTIQNKVSLLHGSINMESQAHKGTVININIPFNI